MRWLISMFGVAFAAVSLAQEKGPDSNEYVRPEVRKQMAESHQEIMTWLDNVDRDIFLPGTFLAKDEVTLDDGTTITGKTLDYGPWVCVVDNNKRWVMPRPDGRNMKMSWGETAPQRPEVPDLDVTYIERLPRYKSNHANVSYDPKEKGVYLPKPNSEPVWPPKGTRTTFKGHIINKGPVESGPFKYEWLVDGKRKARGEHETLNPGEEAVTDFEWHWKDGPHEVTLKVIPGGEDFSAWNNSHTDPTDSLGFFILCSQSAYDGFNSNLNMVESFSFEDWMQYHLKVMNFLFSASIHPGSPLGCFERVRMDKLMILPDENYVEDYEKVGYDDEGYVYHEGKWGFSPWDKYDWRSQNIDWGLIHELGHQLGIIDYYTLDFWMYSIFARDKNGDLFDAGYSYPHTGMMRGHGPHAFNEITAVAMNWERGKHRGHFGDYLFNLPEQCGIRILDFNGNPVPDAEIRIFQRNRGVHTAAGDMIRIPEDPVWEGRTDERGIFMLPNEDPPFIFTTDNGFTRGPSPFGDALVISDTGLILIEIWKNDRRDAQFTDVTQFVLGYGRGYENRFIDDIETILPGENDAIAPPVISSIEPDGWCDRLKLKWHGGGDRNADTYRVYSLRATLPFERKTMNEVATVSAERSLGYIMRAGGWITVTAVDKYGNESAPAVPVWAGAYGFGKPALNRANEVFVGGHEILRIDNRGMAYPVRLRSWHRGRPGYAPVIGFAPDDSLIIPNPAQGRIYLYGKDGVETSYIGEKGVEDGQLQWPADFDLDAAGQVFVADRDGNRISVFTLDGTFVENIASNKIEKPVAVEVDKDGNIYIIEQNKPGVRKVSKDGDSYADPVLFVDTEAQACGMTSDHEGRVYLCQNTEPGLTVFSGDGSEIAAMSDWKGTVLRGMAGMVVDRAGSLVCGMGQRAEIIRIPIGSIIKQE